VGLLILQKCIPNRKSNATVIEADRSNDAEQPSRLDMIDRLTAALSSRSQDDLDNAVLLVSEPLVHHRRVFEAGRVRDDETRIDLAVFDDLKERALRQLIWPGGGRGPGRWRGTLPP
jgi:hypothetical protein